MRSWERGTVKRYLRGWGSVLEDVSACWLLRFWERIKDGLRQKNLRWYFERGQWSRRLLARFIRVWTTKRDKVRNDSLSIRCYMILKSYFSTRRWCLSAGAKYQFDDTSFCNYVALKFAIRPQKISSNAIRNSYTERTVLLKDLKF